MTHRFDRKTVLVTGAGGGIGRAAALAFANEGAAVVLTGRSDGSLAETAELIERQGGRALASAADVTSSNDLRRLLQRAEQTFGPLDVAVNNAGTLTAFGPVGDLDLSQWADIVSVNLTGTLLCMQHEIASMRSSGGGAIVNVASVLGAHKRVAGVGAYVTTKAAVSALTRNAALDHAGEGIRINAVSPGPTDTSMSYQPGETAADRDARLRQQLPAGRVGALEEIAAAILYLASDEAGFILGADLLIDGGASA